MLLEDNPSGRNFAPSTLLRELVPDFRASVLYKREGK
jgi:hypothetical protein